MQRITVFLVFSFGFFVSNVFRGVNLAVAPELSAELHLSPAELGALTSLYFFAFAACQLPLGMFLDRFGPRRVQACLLVCAALGALLFGCAETKLVLMAGRLLIGIGVSACLMGALKAMVTWFRSEQLPSVNGSIFAIGGLGSVAAATPIILALELTDWRGIFIALAVLTAATALVVLVAVPERRSSPPDGGFAAQWSGVKAVLRSRLFWRVAPLHMTSQGAFMAVQGLWAGPWLRDVERVDGVALANAVSLIGLAMVAGYWATGIAARALAARGVRLITTAGAGMLVFLLIQVAILLRAPLPDWLAWTLYGFFGSSGVISYAVLTPAFPAHMAGRVSTALTLVVFVCAFAIQFAVGFIVACWPSPMTGYAAEGHYVAWTAMIVAQLAAFGWYCFGGRFGTARRARLPLDRPRVANPPTPT